METLRFTRALFGLSTSPFLHGGIIDQHLRNLQQNFLNEVEEFRRSLYDDYLITDATTVVETQHLQAAQAILREGRFQFYIWHSNVLTLKEPPSSEKAAEEHSTTQQEASYSLATPVEETPGQQPTTAKYKPKLRQALYGCKDGGDQTARQTVERNSGHNRTGLSRPNRQSNLERNPQEDSQDIRPFGISFTRHLSWKDAVQRNMRRPSTLGLWCSQRAKDRVGELGKSVDRKSRSPKKPSPTTETQAEPQSLGKY